MAEKLVRLRFQ